MDEKETVSFGFRHVDRAEKASMVRAVFDSVAERYDLMNDLMSLGVHRLWKNAFVDWLAPREGGAYLDVAGGTGDIAFRIHDKVAGRARITVCDINERMLSVGRDRAYDRGLTGGLNWVTGNAEQLPFVSRSQDGYTIAFGIRNVTDKAAALREAYRVLRPGGRFLCLEFSKVSLPLFEKIYDEYSFHVLPRVGALVAGDADSYRYLVESIRVFPDQRRFAAMIEEAGFAHVQYRNLSGGIAAIHSGWRI